MTMLREGWTQGGAPREEKITFRQRKTGQENGKIKGGLGGSKERLKSLSQKKEWAKKKKKEHEDTHKPEEKRGEN